MSFFHSEYILSGANLSMVSASSGFPLASTSLAEAEVVLRFTNLRSRVV
jgi:hypothetical protein